MDYFYPLIFIFVVISVRAVWSRNLPRLAKVKIFGALSDSSKTRCQHYHSERDIIAIKFKCCQKFYACILCHNSCEDHEPITWKLTEFDEEAIFCGNCNSLLSIQRYLDCNSVCPVCCADFNSRCSNHYHYYFEIDQQAKDIVCNKYD